MKLLMKMIHVFRMKDSLRNMLTCLELEVLFTRMKINIMMKTMTYNMSMKKNITVCL